MRKLSLLCWILFIGAFIFLRARSWYAASQDLPYQIVQLELAAAAEGKAMLATWNRTPIDDGTLTQYAILDTYVDFFFIIGYTGVLLLVSRRLGRKERQSWLKHLLRWCLPLALLAGLLDVVENFILLTNMQSHPTGDFISVRYVAAPKFILIGVVLLVWIVSFFTWLFTPGKERFSEAEKKR